MLSKSFLPEAMNSRRTNEERKRERIISNPECIDLHSRLMIGRGRDGLIFRIGSENLAKMSHRGQLIGKEWGGWVAKVPRFRLNDLPQHYLRAVAQYLQTQNPESYARSSMVANFNFEGDLQRAIWAHLVESKYLDKIGFPLQAQQSFAWEPSRDDCPPNIKINMALKEDNQPDKNINSALIPSENVHLMPEAVMDAFHALVYHFTPNLLLQFLRDILYQLEYLEKMGVVHGDFKLSNVLLFCWHDEQYIFILADFWDAFSIDRHGSVVEMKPNEELYQHFKTNNCMYRQPRAEFRRLLRWKFTTEKFGTRLYKDPHILNELRQTRKAKSRFKAIQGLNAGAINIWSFGIVMGSLLCANKDSDRIKTEIKEEILFSGRTAPNNGVETLSGSQAVRQFRNLFTELMQPPSDMVGPAKGRMHPNKLLGRVDLIDKLKGAILDFCMVDHDERGTARDVIDALGLDTALPEANKRIITADLQNCGRLEANNRCTMCVWMKANEQLQLEKAARYKHARKSR